MKIFLLSISPFATWNLFPPDCSSSAWVILYNFYKQFIMGKILLKRFTICLPKMQNEYNLNFKLST